MIENWIFSLVCVFICIIISLDLNKRKKKEEEEIARKRAEYPCFGKFLIENKCDSCKVYKECKIKYMDYKNTNFKVCSKADYKELQAFRTIWKELEVIRKDCTITMNNIFTPNLKFKLRSMKSENALLLLFDKIQEFEKSLIDSSKHKVLDIRIKSPSVEKYRIIKNI